jgi:hypothetical protein
MIQISGLYSYPIKSCGAIIHQQVELDARGLVWDRRWMLVDAGGLFISQREKPQMALIQPTIEESLLTVRAPGRRPLSLPLHRSRDVPRLAQVWNDRCLSWDEGQDAADWFSEALDVDCRLVRMTDEHVRRVDERYARRPAQIGFSDGYPLLVVSEASLDDLNRRLIERGKEPVPMSRFRPNVVLSGAEAYAEDGWHTVQIGAVTLDIVKPCARCVITTIDQTTGHKPESEEPLATLNTYRKREGKVLFAQNAIHHAPGVLTIGDAVKIVESQQH